MEALNQDRVSELTALKHELEGAKRLAMLGEASARLAHEVRNPLGAISLYVSMLKQDLAEMPEARALVAEIEKGISTLNIVVTNTLHFAKDRKRVTTPCNIYSIVQEVSAHFAGLFSDSSCISTVLEGDPFILCDSGQIRQMIYNLVMNAAQAVGYCGNVSLTVLGKMDQVEIVVHDSGPGIASQMLDRLFEPFATDKQSGTGLGLAIAKDIVLLHGGSISASNDNGAKFLVSLPRVF